MKKECELRKTIVHLLPETEPFSEFKGGAISRWVANVLRGDDQGMVLCSASDESWKDISIVKTVPHLDSYGRYRFVAYRAGWSIRTKLLGYILRPALSQLKSGDVVWVHNRPDAAAAIESFVHSVGAKLVLHMHNSHLLNVTRSQFGSINADSYVFVSKYLQAEAATLHKGISNGCVLYNGADDRVFYPKSKASTDAEREPTILFASRLVPQKGAHIFIQALRELKQRKVSVRGVVVGAANFGGSKETSFVEDLRHQATDNIQFHPYCVGTELGELFRRSDIFCLPSVWQDPFPLAPLEAMASGLPVVATRSGGIPEALHDGGGILVGPGSVEELADALENLTLDPMGRQRMAAAGAQSFRRNFTWGTVRARYAAVAAGLR